MKACLSALLLLTTASFARAAILTKSSHHVPERMLEVKVAIDEEINKMAEEALSKFNVNVQRPTTCPTNFDASTGVGVCFVSFNDADNSVTIKLYSPSCNFELSFSNINLKDPSSDIQVKPYFDEFLESLADLVSEVARQSVVKAAIEASSSRFKGGEVELGSVTEDKATFKFNGKDIVINYKVEKNTLMFKGDFIDESIDLNIASKKFIEFEVKRMIVDAVNSEVRQRKVALSDSAQGEQGGSQKKLDCVKIWSNPFITGALSDRIRENGLEISVEGTSTITVSHPQSSQSITITCENRKEGVFDLSVVTASFKNVNPNIPDTVQAFLGSSLYNLIPMTEGNFEEIVTDAIRLMSTNIVEESFMSVGAVPVAAR